MTKEEGKKKERIWGAITIVTIFLYAIVMKMTGIGDKMDSVLTTADSWIIGGGLFICLFIQMRWSKWEGRVKGLK